MDSPREYTNEEVRDKFLQHLASMAEYWAHTDLNRPEFSDIQDELLYRCNGVVFSVLTLLDGCCLDLPGFQVLPFPCAEDEEYNRTEGENWFPFTDESEHDIGGGLHDNWHNFQRGDRP